jgi:hypothetical protein
MDHPFEVGKKYYNRHGRYEVVAIEEPKMRVRYEDGSEMNLNIATQALLWKMWQNAPAPEPGQEPSDASKKPKRKSKKAGKAKAPVTNKQEKLIAEILQENTAIVEILQRLVVPPGQINIYRLLVRNRDDFFTMQEIADRARNSDRQSLQSVLRAFGNRISNSPDERVRSLKPYNNLFFERKSSGGKVMYRIRQRVVEIFEGYPKWYDFLMNDDRPWLAEEWGSEHWKNSPDVYRRQMAYFGFSNPE